VVDCEELAPNLLPLFFLFSFFFFLFSFFFFLFFFFFFFSSGALFHSSSRYKDYVQR